MMKSYTLNNWDGSVGGSEERTPQTLTSAHALTSKPQPTSSSFAENIGNPVGSTLNGGEHGKGDNGADNQPHDAWIEGGSTRGDWHTKKTHSMKEVSVSLKEPFAIGQDGNWTAAAENEHSNQNASQIMKSSTLHGHHAPSQSISIPQSTGGPSGEDAQPLRTPISDLLSFSATIHLSPTHTQSGVDSLSETQQNLMFIPDLTSPLHVAVAPGRSPIPSNRSKLDMLNIRMDSPLSSIYFPSDLPSPVSEKLNFDTISVHTADGEGTDEDDEVIILENIPSNFSPPVTQDEANIDSLFTPPPSDKYIPVEELFTPPPKKRKPARSKLLMSHVLLPPLRRPRADYFIPPQPPKRKKRPATQDQEQSDLARAMQASFVHNDTVGALPLKKKKSPKPNRSKVKETKQREPRPPVAGPSRLSSQCISITRKVQQPKRRRNDIDDKDENFSAPKRPRIATTATIDLTLSDTTENTKRKLQEKPKQAQARKEKAKPHVQPPLPSAKKPTMQTSYDAGKDRLLLLVSTISPTPPDLVYYNTRFIRHRILGPTPQNDVNNWATSRKKRRSISAFPWRMSLLKPASTPDSEAEMSSGGQLGWGEGSDDGEGDDEDIIFVDSEPRQEPTPSASVPPASMPRPPKIDLAEQFKKRKRKTQPSAKQQRPSNAAAVPNSPSVSSLRRSSLHQAQTASPSALAMSDIVELPITPSAKALGKRKAGSPTAPITPTYQSFTYTPAQPFTDRPQSPNNNLNTIFRNYEYVSITQPSISTPSTTIMHLQQQILLSPSQFYHGSIVTPGPTDLQSHSSQHDSDALHGANMLTNGFDGQNGDQSSLWTQEYKYETINPMLLGGHALEGDHALEPVFQDSDTYRDPEEYQVPHAEEDSDHDLEDHDDLFRMRPSSPAFQVSALGEERAPSIIDSPDIAGSKEHSQTPDTLYSHPASMFELPPGSARMATSEYSPSASDDNGDTVDDVIIVNKRTSQSTISTPQSTFENRRKRSSFSVSTRHSRNDDSVTDDDVIIVERRKSLPAASTSRVPPVRNQIQIPVPHSTAQFQGDKGQWPLSTKSEMCHQCRNRSYIFKMLCRCGKRFCFRCLVLRYPDRVFNVKGTQETCPCCADFCNCSHCRNLKRPPPPPPPPPPPQKAQYWGTIYSLDGQKIGTTFAAPSQGDLPAVVFSGTQGQPQPTKKLKRTFVGRPQRVWGFGRKSLYKELNPVRPKKSKSPKYAFCRHRLFVGSAAFLRYRFKVSTPDLSDEEDLLGGLSPLTSLSDSDDCDVENKSIQEEVFTPGCLEERDVARAIAASFMSLGIQPTFELPFPF